MLKRIVRGFARPQVIIPTVALAILAAPVAGAVTSGEGQPVKGGARNPAAAGGYESETEIISNAPTYGTRQSNIRAGDGGSAIYGCRSSLGNEPCLRASNLNGGEAFQFSTTGGKAGEITTGSTTGAPFTTNATGVATGLNADRVDGHEATDFATVQSVTDLVTKITDLTKQVTDNKAAQDKLASGLMWAKVDATGKVTASRPSTGVSAVLESDTNTYRVNFGADISACSYTATPQGASTTQTLSVNDGTNSSNVRVDAQDPTAFQVQVIC